MQKQIKALNFEEQNIYAGIDVHLKSWTVTVLTEHVTHKTFSQPPDTQALYKYLTGNFPGGQYHTVYEAGFSGFWLHYQLVSMGVNSIVINAADVPTNQKERTQKTDKVDSRKLARALRSGDLKAIHVPDTSTLSDRSLVRTRSTIVKDMIRSKQRIKSFLYFYGINYPQEYAARSTHWTKRFVKWLRSINLDCSTGTQSLNILIDQLENQREQLLKTTRKIRDLSQSDSYSRDITLLRSIPGIGSITSITLLTELGSISRFSDADRLAAFVGLVPKCHSSGEDDNKGEMTFRHNDHLLQMIIESSWFAVRSDPAMSFCYSKYVQRMDENKAIIRIARKLINRIYAVLKQQKEYVCGINNV